MPIRIAIKAKDDFWYRAFHIEWDHQYHEREIKSDGQGYYLIEPDWYEDMERVAAQCFCRIARAPDSPGRRRWITSFLPPSGRR